MGIIQTLRACGALFRVRMAEGFQYRAAAISGVFIGVFWALIECVIYTVFYRYSRNGYWNNNGMALTQTISYIWVVQGLWVMQFMNIDGDILKKIVSGDVGVELCRPMDLYAHWWAKSAAGKLGTTWIRSLLTFGAGLLMPAGFRLGMPASVKALGCFMLSVVLAFVLCSAFGMLVTAIRLNITWGDGPTFMLMLMSGVLSGGYFPLRLWPDSMQTFLRLQPFGGFADIPAQLYVGSLPPYEALPRMGLQLLWTLIFVVLGRIIMKKRLSSIIIQGG